MHMSHSSGDKQLCNLKRRKFTHNCAASTLQHSSDEWLCHWHPCNSYTLQLGVKAPKLKRELSLLFGK